MESIIKYKLCFQVNIAEHSTWCYFINIKSSITYCPILYESPLRRKKLIEIRDDCVLPVTKRENEN